MIKAKSIITATLVGTATALALAAPASADPLTDNNFLGALSNAGIGYGDPTNTEQLGQSICPMLVEPGKNMASIYSTVSNNGINPQMAAFFTGIAISMYCPSMMSSIGNGTFLNQLSGLNGLGGLTGMGIPGF
ncbi:MAG TPA: DUF732 domain-containing protein [Mycobacterium sp.]|nr:DUF732 domain-containing protein [Mycobacterium sp.]